MGLGAQPGVPPRQLVGHQPQALDVEALHVSIAFAWAVLEGHRDDHPAPRQSHRFVDDASVLMAALAAVRNSIKDEHREAAKAALAEQENARA